MEINNLVQMKNENTRAFLVINTTEYSEGKEYQVQCVEVKENELADLKDILGWNMREEYCRYDSTFTNRVDELEVGESLEGEERGAYIMRVK